MRQKSLGTLSAKKEKEVSGDAGGRKWFKYSPEFKRNAVDRIVAGESPTAVARELGIRCKFLYAWKAEGKGSQGAPAPGEEVDADPQQREIANRQKKISELERFAGRQTAELDFFVAALRSVKERRRKSGAGSGAESSK
jgi:transposase-like protein